jgi:Uma2 family endonuclease
VEVRSPGETERAIQAKIADYFLAGTSVVWDVDADSDEVIRCYRASCPTEPQIFRRGETADAEPAVSGWRFEVDELFV